MMTKVSNQPELRPSALCLSRKICLNQLNSLTLEFRVIDIHCHILPQVDDGSKSWDMSLEMCRMAADDGIEHIVATPHANERFPYDRELLASNLEYLKVLAGQAPRLSLGCDFHLSYDNLQEVLVTPERFTIEDTHYLLVELSNYSIAMQIDKYFAKMTGAGITPVITHPERNPILQETQQRVLQWVGQGCAVQVTASSLTGGWGTKAARVAEWLLERDAVHVLATDAHDIKHRPPALSAAREKVGKLCGLDVAKALVDDNPRAVVSDKPLPFRPNPIMKGK
jgi:protein-tyrosine phosphatase